MITYLQKYVISKITKVTGDKMLDITIYEWKNFQILAKWTHRVFSLVNRHFALPNKLQLIYDRCLDVFQEVVILKNESLFHTTICQQLNILRDGGINTQSNLADIISMCFASESKYDVMN